jgi:tellurite resistance protein TerA
LCRKVIKGSKTTLTRARHVVGVSPSGVVDVMAVLLNADDRVRSDDDLVFFNNPTHDGVELGAGGEIAVDLGKVPDDVHRVVIAGSTEAQGKVFGDVPDLVVRVASAGEPITFTPPGLASETVLQMVAFYRRGTDWKLDAIGQGYAPGWRRSRPTTASTSPPTTSRPLPRPRRSQRSVWRRSGSS